VKYNLDLSAVQEVMWDNGDSEPADAHFSLEVGMLVIAYRQAFSYIMGSDKQLKQ
jgi:hypothetical protein